MRKLIATYAAVVMAFALMAGLGALSSASAAPGSAAHGASAAGVSPDVAWSILAAGNERYAAGYLIHPHQSVARRKEVAAGQHPIAIIVGCADSRVPPEIVFDQGLGDLFVVRVAGNIVDNYGLGSIEYAVEHLDVRLVVVLGHQKCGAVEAAVKSPNAPGHIDSIVKAIQPAVAIARKQPGDLLDNSIRENVKLVVAKISTSQPILAQRVKTGRLKVVGAYYDLDNGKVTLVR